jgi:hypothetical protein
MTGTLTTLDPALPLVAAEFVLAEVELDELLQADTASPAMASAAAIGAAVLRIREPGRLWLVPIT